MNKIKQIIREEIQRLYEEDVDWDLYELMDYFFRQTVEGFLEARKKGGGKQPWDFIPFPRLKKIWEDYIRYGFVRDVKGLELIEAVMTRNIIKLKVNTELSGHADYYNADDDLEDYGITSDDLWGDGFDFGDYMRDEITNISDFGLKPLLVLLSQLRQQTKPEEKLVTIDKMLNVIHHTSDLANIFLKGGSNDLNTLSGYNANDTGYSWDDYSSVSGKYKMGDYK